MVPNRIVPLISDTESKPTAAMRQAIANAEVGDEQRGEDPTVNKLQLKVAELLAKEAALWGRRRELRAEAFNISITSNLVTGTCISTSRQQSRSSLLPSDRRRDPHREVGKR
jgi:hypothetical protein